MVRDVTDEVDGLGDALTRPDSVADIDVPRFDVSEITYLPPTTARNTVFCAGLNYEAHAEESDIDVPERPLIFLIPPRCWSVTRLPPRITPGSPTRSTTRRNSPPSSAPRVATSRLRRRLTTSRLHDIQRHDSAGPAVRTTRG